MRRLGGAALLVPIGLALACGGGSGAGGGQLARIDADTAKSIARSVMLSLDLTANLSTLGADVAGGDVLSSASVAAADAIRIAVDANVSIAASAPVGPVMVSCETGGNITLTGTVANPDTLTPGDHFTADFALCKELDADGEPLTLDGPLDFTVVAFSGDLADLFSLTLDLLFCTGAPSPACVRTFSVADDSSTFTVEGRVRTSSDSTAPPVLSSSATGQTLALVQSPNSVALRGYLTTLRRDDDTNTYELSGNGRIASTDFDNNPNTDDGEVRYEVTDALAGDTNSPPDAGLVVVTGSGSAMQIVPVDATSVDLELDLDGNGTFVDTDTIHTTWAALGL